MRMKKSFVSFFGIAIAVGLVSCSGEASLSSKEGAVEAGMVIDGPVMDASFNEGAWNGLEKAQGEGIANVSYRETKGPSEYAQSFDAYAQNGANIVFGVGFRLEEATYQASMENPDVKFVAIDGTAGYPAMPENFLVAGFGVEQASFLAGYVAGKMTQTGKVGFLGGIEGEIISLFDYGFEAGVRYARPDAQFVRQYGQSFTDVAKGRSIGELMLSQGVDVIFHAASASGTGMIEALREYRLGKGKDASPVWAIGVDQDQYELAPEVILTSVVKRVDLVVAELIKEVADGTFVGGKSETFGLDGGFVGLAESSSHHVSPELLAEVKLVKAQIESGAIIVPKNASEMANFKF